MIQLQSTATASAYHGVKCLIYGKAGAGKTRLCATAPNPIIISAESGLLSLRNYNLPYIQINSYFDLQQAHQWIVQSAEANQFYTVCIDSVSEIIEQILDVERGKTKDPRKAYGEIAIEGIKLLRKFRDLPNKHVYMSAKETFAKDDSTGAMMYQPMLPGQQLGINFPYYFDEVFQLISGVGRDGQRYEALRTRPDFAAVAKDRSGTLDEWEPANLDYVFNKILRG